MTDLTTSPESAPRQKRSILRRILEWIACGIIALPFLGVLGLCGLLFWMGIGNRIYMDWRIQATFRLYPNAQQIADSYAAVGGGSGLKTLYYWSEDSLDKVRDHYETFTLPFAKRNSHEVTVFQPFGEPLPVVTHEFDHDFVFDAAARHFCPYDVYYKCVEVELKNAQGLEELPNETIFSTATPLSPEQNQKGTVIIYRYYTYDL